MFRTLVPKAIPEATERGATIATSGRMGSVHIDLPTDVLKGEVPDEELGNEFPAPPPPVDMSAMPQDLTLLGSSKLEEELDTALRSNVPFLIDVIIDPEEEVLHGPPWGIAGDKRKMPMDLNWTINAAEAVLPGEKLMPWR